MATVEWVSWWNEVRLHQSLGYRTPAEVETELWKKTPQQGIIEIKAKAQEQNPGHFKHRIPVCNSALRTGKKVSLFTLSRHGK
ncbi:hypothetical protein D9V82_09645 [Corynebacterium macginleyi]|nr:hypothetical protein D9V82_09645 [Corynebacterium macginleyi]